MATDDRQTTDDHQTTDGNPSPAGLGAYLQSPRGHELVSRVIAIVEDLRRQSGDRGARLLLLERWQTAIVICVVAAAVTLLSVLGKFDSSTGILFGTLIGFLLGRHKR